MTTVGMTETCPYCGKTATVGAPYQSHARRCERNPDVRALVLSLLADTDNPGRAVQMREYDALAARHKAPRAETLVHRYRSWTAACAHFDLLPDAGYHVNGSMKRHEAEIDAEINSVKAIVAEVRTYERRRGLPVCGVRRLPDGRLAWMVR